MSEVKVMLPIQEMSDAVDSGLLNESDRGLIILAASILEDQLKCIILCQADNHDASRALKDTMLRSLSGFAAKAALCCVFGFIRKEVYLDLMVIKGIRNQVAHSYNEFTVNDEVAKTILSMNSVKAFQDREGTPPLIRNGKVTIAKWDWKETLDLRYEKYLFAFAILGLISELSACCIRVANPDGLLGKDYIEGA
ncbi:MAG: hypothetical protein ABIK45_02940 [Pseudomonadota bacterium]